MEYLRFSVFSLLLFFPSFAFAFNDKYCFQWSEYSMKYMVVAEIALEESAKEENKADEGILRQRHFENLAIAADYASLYSAHCRP